MRVQDWYIQTLEKRAAEEAALDYDVDSQAVANSQVRDNQTEQKAYLDGLFGNAKDVGKDETKLIKAEFPSAQKIEGTMAGNPLVKVGMQQVFFEGLRKTDLLKMASLDYIKMAFQSFNDELAKIALKLPGVGEAVERGVGALAKGSRVSKLPTAASRITHMPTAAGTGRMTPEQLRIALSSVPRRSPSIIDAAGTRQVGKGTWQLGKFAFFATTRGAGKKFLQGTLGKAQKAVKAAKTPPPIPRAALRSAKTPPPIPIFGKSRMNFSGVTA